MIYYTRKSVHILCIISSLSTHLLKYSAQILLIFTLNSYPVCKRNVPLWMNSRKHDNEHKGDILDSHGSEYEDDCLLGYCTVLSGRNRLTFITVLLIDAVNTSKTSVNFYQTI
jgi:hypothetical protein